MYTYKLIFCLFKFFTFKKIVIIPFKQYEDSLSSNPYCDSCGTDEWKIKTKIRIYIINKTVKDLSLLIFLFICVIYM